MIYIKRIYEPPVQKDGYRILIDRLWPRGLKKDSTSIDLWLKDIAPSTSLRKWFGHQSEKWQDFTQYYKLELKENKAVPDLLEQLKVNKTVTLLYAAHDQEHNHAIVLQSFLKQKSTAQ